MAQESARARINALLDENTFVEIGSMVTARNTDFNMSGSFAPGDGVITGYGIIDGHLVYVYSQDASVLGGSIGEMHAKKIVRIYELAMKVGVPVIGMLDCAGLRLQEASDALNAFGEIYAAASGACGVIPQISMIFGNCGGGLAVLPGLTDFTFMSNDAKLFVNSPNSLLNNSEEKNDTAGVKFREECGTVDVSGSEDDIIREVRRLISIIPANFEEDMSDSDITDDPNRGCEGIENYIGKEKDNNVQAALEGLSDNGAVFEMKKTYGTSVVTAFIRMNGHTVGVVANNGALLTAAGCEKAAGFVDFCNEFNIPLVTLTSSTGFAADIDEEKKIAKAVAGLTKSFATAVVPKINVITGDAFAGAYISMNSKALGADMVYAWPQSRVGMMNSRDAARIIHAGDIAEAQDKAARIDELAAEYDTLQSGAVSAAKRGYVDSIIDPVNTRKYIIGTLEMLYTKRG